MCKNEIIGKEGEEIASIYLEAKGTKIIKRNFYCRAGEIDIIAKDKDELIFIEVKTRTNSKFGRPSEAINFVKKKHLYHCIEYYLYSNQIKDAKIRIDAIEVYLNTQIYCRVNHIKNIYV